MTPDDYLEETRARLSRDGNKVAEVQFPGGPVVVGSQAKFRLRWFATKLNLFTVVASVPQVTVDTLMRFTTDSIAYADRLKGRFKGQQTGIGVIPALVSDRVLPDARQLAEARPAKYRAIVVFPVVVDLATNATYSYSGPMLAGSIYRAWVRERISVTLPPPTDQGAGGQL